VNQTSCLIPACSLATALRITFNVSTSLQFSDNYMYNHIYHVKRLHFFTREGARGGTVVEALRYKPEVRGSISDFFIEIILPAALWPWGQLSL
jgi:hypothetical protein